MGVGGKEGGGGGGFRAGKEGEGRGGEGRGGGLAGPSVGWMRVLAGVGEAVVGRARRRRVVIVRVRVAVSVKEKAWRLVGEKRSWRVVGGVMAMEGPERVEKERESREERDGIL